MITSSEPSATAHTEQFLKSIRNKTKFKFFLFQQLPAAFFSGVRLVRADENGCSVSVPFAWFTKNPFRSTYFACLSMAAEMSTGVLSMAHLHNSSPRVSMLVVHMEARFQKKAVGPVIFTCSQGNAIRAAIEQSKRTLTGQTVTVESTGSNKEGEVVATFSFTWSFKAKASQT